MHDAMIKILASDWSDATVTDLFDFKTASQTNPKLVFLSFHHTYSLSTNER